MTPDELLPAAEPIQLPLPLAREAPGAPQGARAIEADFPILEVSRLAQLESYRKNVYRPAYYIHKWWARRTGATFRAILLGTLLPEGHSPLDCFYQANDFQEAVVLDPFMGGGTTVGEALRLGARAIGVDVNPVSWFLVKKIVEPVSLRALDQAFRTLEQSVGQEISRLYETTCHRCHGKAQAVANTREQVINTIVDNTDPPRYLQVVYLELNTDTQTKEVSHAAWSMGL